MTLLLAFFFFSPKACKHCELYLSIWKTALKHLEDVLFIFVEWMNECFVLLYLNSFGQGDRDALCTHGVLDRGDFQRKYSWCIFLLQLVSSALTHLWALLRSEWENRDASSNLLLKKIIQRLMGVVCLCPVGPRSPFLNESWLLFNTGNHISNCNVRAMPHLHNECWKWVLKQKAKPEILPAGEMIAWQVCKLYNGISFYLSYKDAKISKTMGFSSQFVWDILGTLLPVVLHLRGSGIRIMCNSFVFPQLGLWWSYSAGNIELILKDQHTLAEQNAATLNGLPCCGRELLMHQSEW